MVLGNAVADIRALTHGHQPPGPTAPGQELVDDHLVHIRLRPAHLTYPAPARMRPDQHLLHHVLGEGTVRCQHAREAQRTWQVSGRELLECHRASIGSPVRKRTQDAETLCGRPNRNTQAASRPRYDNDPTRAPESYLDGSRVSVDLLAAARPG